MRVLLGVGLVMLAIGVARADDRCMYANQFFASGAVACQTGKQFRCARGTWQPTGSDCSDLNPQGDQPAILDSPGAQAPGVRQPKAPAEPGVPRE